MILRYVYSDTEMTMYLNKGNKIRKGDLGPQKRNISNKSYLAKGFINL